MLSRLGIWLDRQCIALQLCLRIAEKFRHFRPQLLGLCSAGRQQHGIEQILFLLSQANDLLFAALTLLRNKAFISCSVLEVLQHRLSDS